MYTYIFFLILFSYSCKKTGTIDESGSFSSFSVIDISRGNDSAIIKWNPSQYSLGNIQVRYKIRLDNGYFEDVGTATTITIKNLNNNSEYSGKVIAYVSGKDSLEKSFVISDYIGLIIVGRRDQIQNQNVIEAYNVFSGDLVWKTKISDYYETAIFNHIISNDTVFVNANTKSPKLLYALDLKSGNLIYSAINGLNKVMGSMAYDGGNLFSVYSTAFIAIDSKTGNLIWQKDAENGLGFTGTPHVVANKVYIPTVTGTPNVKFKLFALDVNSGSTQWSYEYDGEMYGRVYPNDGKLYFSTSEFLYCLNQSNGELIWKRNYDSNFRIASQLLFYKNKIITGGERYYGIYCLNLIDGATVWNYRNGSFLQSTMYLGNGNLYFNEIGQSYPYIDNILTALDPETGNLMWSRASKYMFAIYADYRIFNRSNFQYDIEVSKANNGSIISNITNPTGYYNQYISGMSLIINKKVYYDPYSGNY